MTSNFVKVNDLNIHYRIAGVGKPVVLLHGVTTSSYLWRKVISSLAVIRRVIALDLPGFGQSDKPHNTPYTLNYFAEVVDGFLRGLGIEQTALVVHDLGGPIGLLWAVQNSKKLDRLVILDTIAHREVPFWLKLFLLLAGAPGFRSWMVSLSGLATMMRWGVVNKKVMTEKVIDAYQTPFATAEARRVLVKVIRVMLKTINASSPNELSEIAEKLSTLSVPVRMIYGEKDLFVRVGMKQLKQDLPNAPLTAIPNCGHFLQEDQPEKLSQLLVEFLS